jgi:hypothetical protein
VKQLRGALPPARDELEKVDSRAAVLAYGHNWFDASVTLAGCSADRWPSMSSAVLRRLKPRDLIAALAGALQECLP